MLDRLTTVLGAAGLGCFGLAFALSGFYPWMITDAREPEATFDDITKNVSPDFRLLKEQYPSVFASMPHGADAKSAKELAGADEGTRAASERAWQAAYSAAVRRGRDVYISEACWHCHSQYVRPVANEDVRFGPVRTTRDDNNAAQRPVLWGTRRVGPDLTHEGGLRTNDWHVAHLWDPQSTSPDSVMPAYRWYFEDGWQVRRRVEPATAKRDLLNAEETYAVSGVFATEAEARAELERVKQATPESRAAERERLLVASVPAPNADGVALVSYLQWLGTWTAPPLEGGTK
jgi:cbb3-type cytochrome c oxidase subunit II